MQYPHFLCTNIISNHILLCMQYLHCLRNNLKSSHWYECNSFSSFVILFIIKFNTLVFHNLSKHLIFSLVFLYFIGLKANASHGVAKEGLTLEKDEHRFICKVKTCNAFYLTKYLLLNHLHQKHSLSTIPGKLKHPSIWQKGVVLSRPCINKCTGIKQFFF